MRRKTEKKGFTIIEVMLFLAITGLMLIGVIGGTYAAIASQRYTDSVRSFAEYLRQNYAEVISPETLKEQGGNDNNLAIYGKAIVFGLDDENNDNKENRIYSATLVGKVESSSDDNLIASLRERDGGVNLQFYCGNDSYASTMTSYLPLWEAKIYNTDKKTFSGTVLIVRSPKSGAVRTVYTDLKFNIKEHCRPDSSSANQELKDALNDNSSAFRTTAVDFCIKADQSSLTAPMRDIRLAPDGRNTSAVSLIDMDAEDSRCR